MKTAFVGFVIVLALLIFLTFGQIILTVGQLVITPLVNLGL